MCALKFKSYLRIIRELLNNNYSMRVSQRATVETNPNELAARWRNGLKCFLKEHSSFFLQAKGPLALKVSKCQKHFFLKLHCSKKNEILNKILLYEARAEFSQMFRSFFGQWSFKKNAFETYWPLKELLESCSLYSALTKSDDKK